MVGAALACAAAQPRVLPVGDDLEVGPVYPALRLLAPGLVNWLRGIKSRLSA